MAKIIVLGNTLVNTMGLIRSVGKTGRTVDLLMEPCVKSRCFVHHSKYVDKVYWLNRMEDALDVLRNKYWNEPEKPVILCGGDPMICLLDAHYDELKGHFCIFNARGEQGRINFFMDKSNQFHVAKKCGLNLIKTWRVRGISRAERVETCNARSLECAGGVDSIDDVTFPCLIKGNNSTSSTKSDMCVCMNRDELCAKLREGVDYLIQEFIEKDFELDIVGFSYNHGRNVFIPATVRKIRESFTRQSDYILLEDIKNYGSIELDRIHALVGEIGYEGIFSVEMLFSKGKYYFLEINLRNDGVGWLYTVSGINYPALWIQYNNGKSMGEAVASAKFRSPSALMSIWDLDNLFRRRVGCVQWFMDLYRTDAFFVLDLSDPMPFIWSTWIHAKQVFKKVLKAIGFNIVS